MKWALILFNKNQQVKKINSAQMKFFFSCFKYVSGESYD